MKEGNEIIYEKLLLKLKKKGETIIDTKNLTQLEIENIIDETINLSIISKLLNLKLITEKQYYILKEKISKFY
ncbi:MAG: hypothetical protein PUD07_02115 [bacterium]|nr:hypothetical protein [bacterium]